MQYFLRKNYCVATFYALFTSLSRPPLASYGCILYLCIQNHTKQDTTMGLGSYWVRKDDQTGEAKTLKPWEETVSNGDKFFPDPHGKEASEEETPQQEH